MNVEKLITEVEKNPILYDKSRSEYKDALRGEIHQEYLYLGKFHAPKPLFSSFASVWGG